MSEGVEWAVHCCVVLAFLPPGATLPAARLAEYYGVPAAYLAKHLQTLADGGILEAVRGRGGGYRLAGAARDVTLLDVVLAVEGTKGVFRAARSAAGGPSAVAPSLYAPRCGIAAAMDAAEDTWRRELGRWTVAGARRDAPVTAQAKGAEWLVGEISTRAKERTA